jgi:hypothetical protein
VPIELESPSGLGLLGLLAPLILLYVLRIRRERRTVSSSWLWRAAERDLMAREPFRRLVPHVSLVLEALAIVALALSFSRPATRGGPIPSEHVAIVVDASASMAAKGPDGRTRLADAQAAARGIVRRLAPGASALLIQAGRDPKVLSPWEQDPRRLEGAILRLRAGDVEGDLGRALALGTSHLKGRPGRVRLFVVTDLALARPDALAHVGVPLELVKVGTPVDNAAIVRVDVGRRRGERGQDLVEAFALVRNFGKSRRSLFVTLSQRNVASPLASRRVDLAPGEQAPAVLSFEGSSGDQGMGLVVDISPKDALPADDRAYLRVPAGRRLPVVLAPKSRDSWLARALASDPDVELFGAEVEALSTSDIPRDAFVVVDGACPKPLPGGDFLLVNPGPGTCYGAKVTEPLEQPVVTSWVESDPRLRFVTFDGVTIARARGLIPDGRAAALVVAQKSTLIADVSGAGRTGTLVGFDVGESTWPLRASFVLFIRNQLELARSHRTGITLGPARTGEPLSLRVPYGTEEVEIEGPDGSKLTVPAHAGLAVGPGPERAGFYFASYGGREPGSVLIPVNLTSAAESSLAEVPPPSEPKQAGSTSEPKTQDAATDWAWLVAAAALLFVVLDLAWLTRRPRKAAA